MKFTSRQKFGFLGMLCLTFILLDGFNTIISALSLFLAWISLMGLVASPRAKLDDSSDVTFGLIPNRKDPLYDNYIVGSEWL